MPAETAPGSEKDAESVLTVEAVTARLAAIEGNSGLEDAVKDLLRPKYEEAIGSLKESAENAAKATAFRESITTAPLETARVKSETAGLPSAESAAVLTFEGSVEELQKQVENDRAALALLQDSLEKSTAELTRVKGRPLEISDRLPVAQRELADTRARLASPSLAADPDSPGRVADRLVQEGAQEKLVNELEMLAQEQLSQSYRVALAQARNELLSRQAENAGIALDALTQVLNKRLANEARQAVVEAEATARKTAGADESIQELSAEIEVLAREYETVVGRVKKASKNQAGVTGRIASLARESDVIREQLKLGRAGGTMAHGLFDLRQRLPDDKTLQSGAKQRREDLGETRLAALEIEEKIRGQEAVEDSLPGGAAGTAAELLSARRETLTRLDNQYGALVRSLAAIDADEGKFAESVRVTRAFVEEELFWIKSSPPLSGKTFLGIPAAVRDLSGPGAWAEFGKAILTAFKIRPIRSVAFVVLLLGLFLARRRLGVALAQTGSQVRRISTERYAHTARALFLSVLLALPIPLLLAGLSWALGQAADPSLWLRAMCSSLRTAALLAMPLLLMSEIYRPGGLGIAHFGWREKSVARLRRATLGFAAVYLPAMLVMTTSFLCSEVAHFDNLGRVCFLLAHVWTAMVLWYLFRPSDGILTPIVRDRPGAFLARFRLPVLVLLLGCPLALVILASLGYLFTAVMLSLECLITAAMVAGAMVLFWMTLRWFTIREHKLALAEAIAEREARREARREAASAEAEVEAPESGEVVSVEEEDDELDLSSLCDQTRRLLQFLFGVGTLILIGVFWSRTIPLLSALDEIHFAGGLSLLGVGQAVLIILVTAMTIQNLPGLLGLAVLGGKEIGTGTRVAIVTLCQYALVAIALALLFNVLNVDWSKFGWIAAALSLGLGFGLQEVVANFVCGLILLFERPIRVGDVVTMEGHTGTVTKIQMRATTIINWDRQELVVPNKNLVTGTLLNWTLTAALNRIFIKVGVAYGTDARKARQIMLDIAADHPRILDDPAPMASFDEFADSTLNLSLRAYLPDMDNRVATVTELNDEIDRRFAEEGIEIAFPQHDLHLRSMGPEIGFGMEGNSNRS